ncbi:hypothetical protein DAI22_03g355650 [Oryza sativa Japonica Group]|nr:hypothetical protein DAI22_03g355650 [Oryza sativa Japonica Group]
MKEQAAAGCQWWWSGVRAIRLAAAGSSGSAAAAAAATSGASVDRGVGVVLVLRVVDGLLGLATRAMHISRWLSAAMELWLGPAPVGKKGIQRNHLPCAHTTSTATALSFFFIMFSH